MGFLARMLKLDERQLPPAPDETVEGEMLESTPVASDEPDER
jgi:hypothetical protein